MAEKELIGLVNSFKGISRQSAFTAAIIGFQRLSFGVDDGSWSENANQEEFSLLRQILNEEKERLVSYPEFMSRLLRQRSSFPRTHWWWWIEEL